MGAKAEQWKRLYRLLLDPGVTYVARGRGGTWATDMFVLVDLGAAGVDPAEPGTWRLLGSGARVRVDDTEGTLPDKEAERKLRMLEGLAWSPAVVTPWALCEAGEFAYRLLVTDAGEPVLMNDVVVRAWTEEFRGTDALAWHVARAKEGRVARATLRRGPGSPGRIFGYLMGTKRQASPLPPFPELAGCPAAGEEGS